eukprot:11743476-Prorocentrum_lima.AAC.1
MCIRDRILAACCWYWAFWRAVRGKGIKRVRELRGARALSNPGHYYASAGRLPHSPVFHNGRECRVRLPGRLVPER